MHLDYGIKGSLLSSSGVGGKFDGGVERGLAVARHCTRSLHRRLFHRRLASP